MGVEAPMTLKPEFVLWDYLKCGNGSLMTSGTFKIVAKISGLMLQELSVLILLSVLVEERMQLVILFVTCKRRPSLYCLLKEV